MRLPRSIVLVSLSGLLFACAAAVDFAREIYIRLDSTLTSPEITITLNNSFIETYKNRATIDVRFTIDKASKRPKPAFLDGDFHMAGRIAEIGLPVVVEIKNSAFERAAIDIIHQYEGSGTPIRVSGAWRIWFAKMFHIAHEILFAMPFRTY